MHYDGALKGIQGKGLFLKIKKKKFSVKPSETNHGIYPSSDVFISTPIKTSEEVNLNDKRQLNRINQSV